MQNSHPRHMATVKSVWVFASLGCVSQVCQVVLLRELLTLAEGTELTVALVLGTWLVLTALGSVAASKLVSRRKFPSNPLWAYSLLSPSLAAFSFLDIWFIRSSRVLLSLPPGEPLSASQWLLVAFAALLPICTSIGAQFVFAASFASAAEVYIAESLGAVVAGAALSLFLLQWIDHTSLLAISLTLHLLMTLWVVLKFQPNIPLSFALALVAALTLVASPFVENQTQIRFWRSMLPSGKLVRSAKSPYGSVTVVRYGDQLSVYQSGHLLFTLPDRGEISPLVHLILLQHPKPNRVLLIGGLGGWVKAVLEHPKVVGVDWVEVDPTVPKLVLPLLPERERVWASDPRLELHFSDGRSFIRQVRRPYDVIIVVASDPTTAAANRFFTREFFAEVVKALSPGGVFALHGLCEPPSGFSEFYLMRNNCVYRTMLTAFCQVLVVPSSPLTLLAKCPTPSGLSSGHDDLTLHENTLLQRAEERKLGAINIFAFTDPVQVERVNFELKMGLPFNPLEREQVREVRHKWLNSDTNPTVYFLSSLFWLKMSNFKGTGLLESLAVMPRWAIWLLLPLPFAIWLIGRLRSKDWVAPAMTLTLVSGVGMSAELTILLAFQARCGTLYQQVGLLFGLFMSGLAFGAWAAKRWGAVGSVNALSALALATGLAVVAWWCCSLAFSAVPTFAVALGCGFFMVVFGGLVGAAYPLAVQALTQLGVEGRKAAGLAYAYDLLGGTIGAFFLGALSLPLWGTSNLLWLCFALCLSAAFIVAIKPQRN